MKKPGKKKISLGFFRPLANQRIVARRLGVAPPNRAVVEG